MSKCRKLNLEVFSLQYFAIISISLSLSLSLSLPSPVYLILNCHIQPGVNRFSFKELGKYCSLKGTVSRKSDSTVEMLKGTVLREKKTMAERLKEMVSQKSSVLA